MGASHTAKEHDSFTKKEVDQFIGATAQYISAWTHREFNKLSTNKKLPLIWPLPQGGYIIGNQRIVPANGYWKLQDQAQETRHIFDGKQSAIFYCLCNQLKQYHLADRIRGADSEVMRHKNDVIHYENSVRRAEKNADSFGIGVWSARLDDSRLRLNTVQAELQKSIKSAKYLKIWSE